MPRIKMKKSTPGSNDGITTMLFEKDQEYDVHHELALAFITHMGVATQVRTRQPEPEETAVEMSAPETKEHPEPATLTEEEVEAESNESFEESDSENEADEPEVDLEPKSTRVYALAKELGCGWEVVIEIANKLGIEVKAAASGLTDSQVEKIKADFEK